ncbi:Ribosomal L18p/L5e family [Musa troglodytarum]|uniref:Ribosomal L18p/L5e family n=1 Tax=Musa troglodytarum TaxID=320322 RepID=A0A9E7JW20_9LILI|nr:Ribosomal L18p/L5e family [Musa troglodytarum]URD95760.1 Ribosomal L18p/L5e family [Musa troglodytarum]
MIKLLQIIPSGRDNLENRVWIEVVGTDLVGISFNPMKSLDLIDGGMETLSSSLEINDETCSCSSAALAEESLGFDEIEDLRLHKKLFYKLNKGSKEFEGYNIQFHCKKSAKKSDERTTKLI